MGAEQKGRARQLMQVTSPFPRKELGRTSSTRELHWSTVLGGVGAEIAKLEIAANRLPIRWPVRLPTATWPALSAETG